MRFAFLALFLPVLISPVHGDKNDVFSVFQKNFLHPFRLSVQRNLQTDDTSICNADESVNFMNGFDAFLFGGEQIDFETSCKCNEGTYNE